MNVGISIRMSFFDHMGMDERFAWHAAIVQTVTAKFGRLFDQRDFQSELCRHAGHNQSTGAAANNHQITFLQL